MCQFLHCNGDGIRLPLRPARHETARFAQGVAYLSLSLDRMSESEENEGNIGLHVMISVRGPWSLSWPADSDAKLPARCVPHPGFINPTIGSVYFSCLVLFSLSRLPPLFFLLLLSKSSLPCKSEAISEGIRHDACTKTQ